MPYDKLFVNLACCVCIGARSFCTKLGLRAWSVQKTPWSDISLYIPRVRLIRCY